MENVLTYMTFIPLAGAVFILFLPSAAYGLIRWVAAAATVPPLLMAVWLFNHFDRSQAGFQFVEKYQWIPAYNITYFMGIDGISISMVLLTALLSFICIFASLGIDKAVKGYFALFLLLDAGMMGVFFALDFFLFYIFWEVMLLPMYFLIGIWGGPRREYAAIKFFLYTLVWQRADAACHFGALFHQRAAHFRYDPTDGAGQPIWHQALSASGRLSNGVGASSM